MVSRSRQALYCWGVAPVLRRQRPRVDAALARSAQQLCPAAALSGRVFLGLEKSLFGVSLLGLSLLGFRHGDVLRLSLLGFRGGGLEEAACLRVGCRGVAQFGSAPSRRQLPAGGTFCSEKLVEVLRQPQSQAAGARVSSFFTCGRAPVHWIILASNFILLNPSLWTFGCGSKPMVPLWARCTTHFSLF